jgi:hypothetical protein
MQAKLQVCNLISGKFASILINDPIIAIRIDELFKIALLEGVKGSLN